MQSQKPLVRLQTLAKLIYKMQEYTSEKNGKELNEIDKKLINGIFNTNIEDVKFLKYKSLANKQDDKN